MAVKSTNTKRIAKNTVLLYVRMLVVMAVNLFTVRIVLNALGEQDYGIFNAVAGVITMLNCVTHVLTSATQRYLSYSLGEKNDKGIKDIFSASINIYAMFSLLVIVLGETAGLWFINTQLTIPADRMAAANWIYQITLISFVISIMQSPYSAATIAHEDMGVFAVVSLVDCFLKLGLALIMSVIAFDRLIFYGSYMLFIHLVGLVVYTVWCARKYRNCRYGKVSDRSLYKGLLSFSGWSLFGSVAGVGMNQVNTILVNIFFGPIANAARAIALQIYSAINSFCSSFLMAIRPPMIKSYAEEDYSYLNKLFNFSNKMIFYCLLMFSVPMFLEMDSVLHVWLKSDNVQTILFSRLILVYTFIMALNNPISFIMQASGKVKEYFVPVETFTLLCMPATWLLFKVGCPAQATFYAMIVAAMLSHVMRLICLHKYYEHYKVSDYLLVFLIPGLVIGAVVVLLSWLTHGALADNSLLRFFAVLAVSIVSTTGLCLLFGLNKDERATLKQLIAKMFKR